MGDKQDLQETFDNTQSTHVLNPAGAGAPVTYNVTTPIYQWVVYNSAATDVWVAFDQAASAVAGSEVGYKIPPKGVYRLSVITRSYISVDGGDGSDVDCSPFKYES